MRPSPPPLFPPTPEQIAQDRENAINATHYPSWLWDEEAISYVPPIPYPTDGDPYLWDEETLSWTPFN